jgi:hypothetical protein
MLQQGCISQSSPMLVGSQGIAMSGQGCDIMVAATDTAGTDDTSNTGASARTAAKTAARKDRDLVIPST